MWMYRIVGIFNTFFTSDAIWHHQFQILFLAIFDIAMSLVSLSMRNLALHDCNSDMLHQVCLLGVRYVSVIAHQFHMKRERKD